MANHFSVHKTQKVDLASRVTYLARTPITLPYQQHQQQELFIQFANNLGLCPQQY